MTLEFIISWNLMQQNLALSVEHRLTQMTLQVAFHLHKELGPGLLESTYQLCLAHQLSQLGLQVELSKGMPLMYDDLHLDVGYKVPMLIENKLVIDIKSHTFSDLHVAQMKTYLKLSQCQMGLLFNFNLTSLKQGVRRIMAEHFAHHDGALRSAV